VVTCKINNESYVAELTIDL